MGNLKLLQYSCLNSKSSKLAFYFDKKFNNERHCTSQYVMNLFVNVHRWLSAGIICFLGLAFRLVKVTERWQISFLYFNNIGLMQCSQTLSVIISTDWEENHWSNETSPAF
jgi:hypothetical protein